VLVASTTRALDAARATAVLARLDVVDVVDGSSLPTDPWDVSTLGVVVRGRYGDAVEAVLLDAVARGAGAIVGLDPDRPSPSRLVDALDRTAPVLDWIDCPLMTLGADQIRLLHALADGTSTRAAARSVHLSERTAHRRLADAKRALGFDATNAAAAEVDSAVRRWGDGRVTRRG